jgi:alkylhydroperoxidase/carboxymuconolactone decarboxylase family protein YurZ
LIAIAIDAEDGAVQGAIPLGQMATELGVTKEEIIKALRIALFTSAVVLKNLFK